MLIASVSGVAALGLGVLYASGALLEATRLHGTHVQVRDTLPLIPLPSLLSLGIGIVIGALIWTVFFGFLVALVVWTHPGRGASRPGWPSDRRARRVLFVSLAVVAVVLLLMAPPFEAARLLVIGFGSFLAVEAGFRRGVRALLPAYAAMYLAVVAVGLTAAYAYPDPLPRIHLVSPTGGVTSGRLIVHTDGLWYIVRARERVTAVADARAARTEIALENPERHRTLGALFRDVFR